MLSLIFKIQVSFSTEALAISCITGFSLIILENRIFSLIIPFKKHFILYILPAASRFYLFSSIGVLHEHCSLLQLNQKINLFLAT